MEKISKAEAALLGLLNDGAKYAYQIEKEVYQRDMRYWTELSMSSIYKLLNSLEKRSVLTSKVEVSEENRTRKVYEMTELGKQTLIAKLKEIISEPEHMRWEFDVGISNIDLIEEDQIIESLTHYEKKLEERIDGYAGLMKYLKKEGCPDYRMGLASRPLAIYGAELKWVRKYKSWFETRGKDVD